MQLELPVVLASGYRSGSQRARVVTEPWVAEQAYCPSCGGELMRYTANKPVADFLCPSCASDYELKSKKGRFASKAADGAYDTMISRISGQNAPSFFFLGHDDIRVHTFFTVPSHYFTPDIIEKRRPLGPAARRAGWVGCNILLRQIPASGRIYYIRNGEVQSRQQVMDTYAATSFLRNAASSQLRGCCWMSCAVLKNWAKGSFLWMMSIGLNTIWLYCIHRIETSDRKSASSCNTFGIWDI